MCATNTIARRFFRCPDQRSHGYDGTGQWPRRVDVGIPGDRIVATVTYSVRGPNPSLMQPALPSLPAIYSTLSGGVAPEMGVLSVNAAADCASKVVAWVELADNELVAAGEASEFGRPRVSEVKKESSFIS